MTARRNLRVYLEDIRAAIARIQKYTVAGRQAFFADEMIQDAVIRQLTIIGEAAARLPPALVARYPDIPWRQVVGMRNILIHDYSGTSLDTIWTAATRDLASLDQTVESMQKELAA